MQRRNLLIAVGSGTVTLAGCIADSEDSETTPTPQPCTVDREEPVDPGGEIEPRELPERPDQWTEETLGSFLEEYEGAYRQHKILSEGTTAFGHSASVRDIQETERGYRVELRTNYYYNEQTERGEVHADSPYYTVVYLVAADRLLRVAAENHSADPHLENADTMECW